MSDGKKYDNGKIQPALVLESMSRALLAVAEVATHGAEKYAPDNWLKVDDGLSRYKNAKHRHMLQGAVESHDRDSGLLHAAHEAWNALAVLELMLRAKPAIDDQVLDGWDKQAVDAAALVNPTVVANVEAFNAWDAGEKRMDIIGPNGNDGIHYRALTLPEDATIPESAHFIVVYENGQMVAHDLKPVLVQGCWHAAAGNQYIGLGDGSQAGLYERTPGDIWVRAAD